MKILDRYILSRFLFNFFSSLVILLFIFIFQSIWLFIDDLAGKGLDFMILGKFLLYLTPELMDKVIPLTVLLSSILTFGTFAENYEFAAMKASGISLQRAMLGLILFVVLLGGVTFYFANSVIPITQQKFYNMRKNIAKLKPAAAIEKGVFSDFEGMNIKVADKYGENDRFLRDIIIHQKSKTNLNTKVIKAKDGELISSEASEVIQLVLKDGHYYEDRHPRNTKARQKHPFVKSDFQVYRMNIPVPEVDEDLEADQNVKTYKMKNVSRLAQDIDSLKKDNKQVVHAFSKNISNRMGAFVPLIPVRPEDSLRPKPAKEINLLQASQEKPSQKEEKAQKVRDTLTDVLYLYSEGQQLQLLTSAKNSVSNILTTVRGKKEELQNRYKLYNLHILSMHKKYALGLSCIILFFVGAPLGAIIRKGGLGLPMVVAIILFLTYYFLGVFAGNYAKEGNIHPILGAWLSTIVMLPLGMALTRRATTDRSFSAFSGISQFFGSLFKRKKKKMVR